MWCSYVLLDEHSICRIHETEPYVPQFYTGREPGKVEEEEEEEMEEVVVPEGAIWDLSSRF